MNNKQLLRIEYTLYAVAVCVLTNFVLALTGLVHHSHPKLMGGLLADNSLGTQGIKVAGGGLAVAVLFWNKLGPLIKPFLPAGLGGLVPASAPDASAPAPGADLISQAISMAETAFLPGSGLGAQLTALWVWAKQAGRLKKLYVYCEAGDLPPYVMNVGEVPKQLPAPAVPAQVVAPPPADKPVVSGGQVAAT